MQANPLDEDDWALLQVIENPVMFREFINEGIDGWKPLEDHERAWTTCQAHFIVMCCGRGVHKTTSMIEMLYWWMVNGMNNWGDDAGLFVLVPNQAQKTLSFDKVKTACLEHWLIRQFVNPNSINKTDGLITFKNGYVFMLRIAGESGKETNVIGIHTYRIWVDEAQAVPWPVWQSLQNCLKKEVPGYQMLVSGVPTGAREENVLYECDQVDPDYVSFNVAQSMMSTWTDQMEYEARKKYHAQMEDTEDYKHFVLGQHGMQSYAVFDRSKFSIDDYNVDKRVVTQMQIEKFKRIGLDGTVRYALEELLSPPPMPVEYGVRPKVGLGYDVGYNPDPTVFFIMVQTQNGAWRNLARYVLESVSYPIQTQVLTWLDNIYSFDFIGIDMGGPGKPQYQYLAHTEELKSHRFEERLFPVEFGGYMTVAIDADGKERKDQTKRVAVERLSQWVHTGRYQFARIDSNLMEELERTKFTRTLTGEPVYRTRDDHQMAAMMCAIMANEDKYGVPILKEDIVIQPKLMSARWLDPYNAGVY